MNKKERLILALLQLENLMKITSELDYPNYLQSGLFPMCYELKRQLELEKNK